MNSASDNNSFNERPLSFTNERDVPQCRVRDAVHLRTIAHSLLAANQESSLKRARIQRMFDGAPPWEPAVLRRTRQEQRCNVNFGEAEAYLEDAVSGYIDLMHAVEDLVSVPFRGVTTTEDDYYAQLIAREVTRTLREWPQFSLNYLQIVTQFIMHGVGVGHFEDASDWRWRAAGLGDFLMPRGALASEDELDIAVSARAYSLYDLYSKIADPEIAEAAGWNVEATRKALVDCAVTRGSQRTMNFEALEVELKSNDFYGVANATFVEVFLAWVREFDGTVTHVVGARTGEESCLLYKKEGYIGSMTQGFVLFPYGIGTNGHIHSIRGLGHKIYAAIQVSNRMRSQLIDGAMLAASIKIQPKSGVDLDRAALSFMGPYAVVSPEVELVEAASPNFSQSVIPVLADMNAQLQQRTGQYSPDSLFSKSSRRSDSEMRAHLAASTRLTTTSLNLFYGPWDRLLRECVRRMLAPNYPRTAPGGDDVARLRARLADLGVPNEAFSRIDFDAVRAVRAIGAGSPAARSAALGELAPIMGSFDANGQHNLLRDITTAAVGADQAERYITRSVEPRVPVDAKIAELENASLLNGAEISVGESEMHMTHIPIHLKPLQQLFADAEAGQPLEEIAPRMLPLYQHLGETLKLASGAKYNKGLLNKYAQLYQQLGEVIHNGMEKRAAMEQAAAEQAAQAQQAGEAGAENDVGVSSAQAAADAKLRALIDQHELKMKLMADEHARKMAIMAQNARMDAALKQQKELNQ